jgi:hypothetical protein
MLDGDLLRRRRSRRHRHGQGILRITITITITIIYALVVIVTILAVQISPHMVPVILSCDVPIPGLSSIRRSIGNRTVGWTHPCAAA